MRHGPQTWSFRSDDLDEVREFVGGNFGDHSRVTKGSGRLGFEFSGAADGGVVVARVVARLPSVIRASVATTTLHLPLHGRYAYRIGHRSFEASPGQAMLIAAGHDYTLQSSAGVAVALQLGADLLAPEFNARRRSGTRRARPLQSSVLRMSGDSGATLRQRLRRITDVASSGERGVAERLRSEADGLAALVAECLSGQAGAGMGLAGRVHLAESLRCWIEEHLAEPITLERLARLADASPRSVQRSFMLRWGQTPMQYVAARRLAAVHERLQAPGPNLTVARAAMDCGLCHLGRFAAVYKQAYGQSPSQTVARARQA
jgi:AraC-like DNA-binding protein